MKPKLGPLLQTVCFSALSERARLRLNQNSWSQNLHSCPTLEDNLSENKRESNFIFADLMCLLMHSRGRRR